MAWFARFRQGKQPANTAPSSTMPLPDAPSTPPPVPPISPPPSPTPEESAATEQAERERTRADLASPQFQTLTTWVNPATFRAKRVYFLAHLELLDPYSDRLFALLSEHYASDFDAAQSLRQHYALLCDIRQRGGTPQAIDDAFVNAQGGFSLPLPEWLEPVVSRVEADDDQPTPTITPSERVTLWREALARARQTEGLAPPIIAAICVQLWSALYFDQTADPAVVWRDGNAAMTEALAIYSRDRYPLEWAVVSSNYGTFLYERCTEDREATLEKAIAQLNDAVQIITSAEMPVQWATMQNNLGNVYKLRLRGDHADNLETAIAYYQASVAVLLANKLPLQWANAQNLLGVTYMDRIRGDREANIEEALKCYSACLSVFTQERTPVQWAMVVNNLGIGYKNRLQGDHAESLESAIACYNNALVIRTRDRFPSDWGVTQNNLGNVYIDRIRGDRAANVEQAIACFTAALEVRTREGAPSQWALTTSNLGKAYLARLQGNAAENIEQGIAYLNDALQVYVRDAFPADWASTQNLLGNAYLDRLRGSASANREEAIAHYQAALTLYTRDAYPTDWARTLANLGNAYRNRIQGDKGANIEQAIQSYTAALKLITRDTLATDWAVIQNNLGNAYFERVQGDHATNIEAALAHYQAALEIYTREAFPTDWAMTANNVSAAYSARVAGDRAANQEQAIALMEATLQVYDRATFPVDWATSQHNLGKILLDRVKGDRADNVERAMACFANALQIFTPTDFPAQWAMTRVSQGNGYRARIRGDQAENIELAIAATNDALRVYTHEAFPADWALAQNNLGNAYGDRLRGDHAENVESAIAAYTAALQVRQRTTMPIDWAATQINLGATYDARVRGDRGENLERAIACYEAALAVYTRAALPQEWAKAQNNLGVAYLARMQGERGENIERAIACYQATLAVYTRDGLPIDWARMQNNLGTAFYGRRRGDRAENLEQAIAYCNNALAVYTRDAFPVDWAQAQSNLGRALRERIAGERAANLDAAVASFTNALQIYTRADRPRDWARMETALGATYRDAPIGDHAANLARAAAYYNGALQVYTRDTAPDEYRETSLNLAEIAAEQGDWATAHAAYGQARETEQLLLALSTGEHGRDAILQEGRDAGVRDSFVLAQLGRLEEALVTVEQSRARALAEARALDAADPSRIGDADRRARYLAARQHLSDSQAALNLALSASLTEEERRQADLARIAAAHQAREAFDAIITEIQAARDPAGFLRDDLTIATLWQALAPLTATHALVYLIATPWGGKALIAAQASAGNQCAALDLPGLTSDFVNDLIQLELNDRSGRVVGGFGHAQEGRGFSFISHIWPGATFAAKVTNIDAACAATGQQSTLASAAREIMGYPALAALADAPLGDAEYHQIDPTFSFAFLQHELRRCLPALANQVLQPVAAWLQRSGVSGATLVPCGALAAFPLLAAPMDGERAFADLLPATLVPSARSLLHAPPAATTRAGVYALGDPWPTHQKLEWGEAEALGVAKLGGDPSHAVTHENATRAWLLATLRQALVIDACCHGEFDPADFLQSRLLLANNESLTLGDMLSGDTTSLQGLRLLILSACQTAILDLRGARDEVRSLATGMLQGGAQAVLGALWSVDDRATYLLMLRFAQEWLPQFTQEAPAAALARAQRWLRGVTYRELRAWSLATPPTPVTATLAARGGGSRYGATEAVERITATAEFQDGDTRPYADPIYWSAFQLTGW